MGILDIHPSVKCGPNLNILGNLTLAEGVEVGANTTFYPDVTVGKSTRILPGAVIGRPPFRAGTTNRPIDCSAASVRIGSGCVIGANCVLYTDLQVGNDVLIGDLASIREGCQLADETVVGRGVMIMYDTTVEARSRIIDGAIITGNMRIESDVFIGPGVTTINDNDVYLKRFGLTPFEAVGPRIRRFAVVGTGAAIAADIEIGMGAIVAPGAMVTKDVPSWTIVGGIPAREIRKIDDETRLQVLRHFGLTDGEGQ